MINKIKNPKPNDEPRMTFNYFKMIKLFSRAYFEFNFKIYDYFLNLKHNYLFSTDLKHVYFIISLHFKNRHYFIFIIFEINQIQFTRI